MIGFCQGIKVATFNAFNLCKFRIPCLTSVYCARKINVNASTNVDSDATEGNSHAQANGSQGDSKLELFGFDSLVNILGLKRYAAFCYSIQLISFMCCCFNVLHSNTALSGFCISDPLYFI